MNTPQDAQVIEPIVGRSVLELLRLAPHIPWSDDRRSVYDADLALLLQAIDAARPFQTIGPFHPDYDESTENLLAALAALETSDV